MRFALFLIVLAIPVLYSGSSAASLLNTSRKLASGSHTTPDVKPAAGRAVAADALKTGAAARESLGASLPSTPLPAMFQALPEDIGAFDDDCATPKTVFAAGETVCAKASGVFLGPRVIYWISPESGGIVQTDVVSLTSMTATRTVNARGQWRLYLSAGDDGTLRKASSFSVSDAAQPSVDLSIHNTIDQRISSFAEGHTIRYLVTVTNNGPDAATGVNVSVPAPNNTTHTSSSQDSGPACVPSGTAAAPCAIASLAAGEAAEFNFVYTVNSGTTRGTEISNTASVASGTEELHAPDNSSATSVLVTGEVTDTACVLECPNDIVVSAGAPENGQPGAVVNFGSAETFGSCGSLTASPASGSFFPVGTTPVTVSSEAGGGGCTFNVTVVEAAPPTISCPANVVRNIEDSCTTTVDAVALGAPTASEGTTVSASRSDGQPIGEPFSSGTTTVTWTATDGLGRSASCTQTVTVNVTETTPAPPTITAPANLTLSSGSDGGACGLVVPEGMLGRAEGEDGGCAVTISRSGVPTGNFFPVGTTTVTWTATDASGLTATATQTVTVVEDTPPSIKAPADLSFTCPSEVPAPNASLATGTDPNLPNGGPVSDNCGVPTVTVSDAVSGAGSAASPLIITRTYTATDAAGNTASSAQTITVIDDTAPSVALVGSDSMTHECHAAFADPGVTTGDNCGQNVSVATSGGFNPDVPGAYVITYTATDAAGNTATVQRTVTVVDTIKPVITLNGASAVTHECHVSYSDAGATAADGCDTGVVVTTTGSVDVNTPGTYTLTYNATDASGNAATPVTRTVTVVDTTPPAVSCPANIVVTLPLNTTATSMPVSFPAPTAADSCGGATVATSVASGSVFNVGTTPVTVTATDDHGNSSSCTFTVTVLYQFTGFFSPIDNAALNQANAGRTIPIKFSLSGNKGLGIFAAGHPASQQVACGSETINDVQEATTTSNSGLTYSPDQYHYNWKTEGAWAGTCRELIVKLNDGSTHTARFKFK